MSSRVKAGTLKLICLPFASTGVSSGLPVAFLKSRRHGAFNYCGYFNREKASRWDWSQLVGACCHFPTFRDGNPRTGIGILRQPSRKMLGSCLQGISTPLALRVLGSTSPRVGHGEVVDLWDLPAPARSLGFVVVRPRFTPHAHHPLLLVHGFGECLNSVYCFYCLSGKMAMELRLFYGRRKATENPRHLFNPNKECRKVTSNLIPSEKISCWL